MPIAFQELCSADKAIREHGYWQIDNHVILQGDLYEPAPFVITGLLGCLTTDPPSREEIYNLLVEFAYGHTSDNELARATLESLAQGLDLYWRDLRNTVGQTKVHVANLILGLSNHIRLDSRKLQSALKAESNQEVRVLLLEAAEQNQFLQT